MQDWAIRRTPAAFRNAFARPTKGMAFVTAVETSANRAIGVWMAGMSAAVFGMVAVGGYTRLTRSGLSVRVALAIIHRIPRSHTNDFRIYFRDR